MGAFHSRSMITVHKTMVILVQNIFQVEFAIWIVMEIEHLIKGPADIVVLYYALMNSLVFDLLSWWEFDYIAISVKIVR